MIAINTNIMDMSLRNSMRVGENAFRSSVERLGNGSRINNGADDPSGLAMTGGMKAQVRGIATAITNIQDNINLIHTAEAGLGEIHDSMSRIRELALRLSNTATLASHPKSTQTFPPNEDDFRNLKDEVAGLMAGIRQLTTLTDFNKKAGYASQDPNNLTGILDGLFDPGQQTGQIGPDNEAAQQLDITFESIRKLTNYINAASNPLDPPPDAGYSDWVDYARNLLADITETNASAPAGTAYGLPSLERTMSELGVLENRMTSTLDDLQTEYINISASKSTIEDADFAQEITKMTSNMIVSQASQSVATQANAAPLIVSRLLGAIYDGMLSGPFNRHG